MKWSTARAVTAVTVAMSLAVGPALPAAASAPPRPTDQVPVPAIEVPPGMLSALQRDLGLTAAAAEARLAREEAAIVLDQQLRAALGNGYAGSWLAGPEQRLVVAITDPSQAGRVRAAGAQPQVVARSERQLEQVMAGLDRVATPPSTVSGWYVDVMTNSVVVQATSAGALPAASEFVASSGVDATAVRREVAPGRPELTYPVRGGDGYGPGFGPSCSVGFSVIDGYVTAGHCGDVGMNTWGCLDGACIRQGVVRGSTFPGRDHGWVEVNANWTPVPVVHVYGPEPSIEVTGLEVAAVGASVCRSGWRTGWRCGKIEARNVTVRYDEGTVTGLTRTSACADSGDSGGPFVSGLRAQGVHSGSRSGSGCTSPSYFQPLRPILSAYGLNLLVAGGGSVPTAKSMNCSYIGGDLLTCILSYVADGPVQIRWYVNGVARPQWNNRTVVTGACSGSTSVWMELSNGSGTWTENRGVSCFGDPM